MSVWDSKFSRTAWNRIQTFKHCKKKKNSSSPCVNRKGRIQQHYFIQPRISWEKSRETPVLEQQKVVLPLAHRVTMKGKARNPHRESREGQWCPWSGQWFLDMKSKAWTMKAKIDKWNYIQTKNSYAIKGTEEGRHSPQTGEKINHLHLILQIRR